VVVVGDLNGDYGSTDYGEDVRGAIARIVEMRPGLVLSTGDLVAGQRPGLDYRAMWRGFRAEIGDPLEGAGIPFAPSPGNHDASAYGRHATEREVFVDEWRGRAPAVEALDVSAFPLRYSFVAGGALFVALDATTIGPLDAEQLDWARAQLERGGDRAVKIVFGHLPIHPFTHGRERETLRDDALAALLVEHDVDLYVSGHHHGYFPGKHGALRVVSVGCLGGGPRPLIGTDTPSPRSFVVIDVDPDGIERVDALLAPEFEEIAARASLPERVGDVVRDDL
jgi:3',5'-cyclic AMP phosphodiesterase CpdA